MNVLLLTSHSIAEYDDLRMLHGLGYDVFSIGAYTDPANPTDDKRPALPDVPHYADLAERCERQRAALGDPGANIDWAKAELHPDIIDWADVIIVHHFVDRWIAAQWPRIGHKRVIWRTCGQSNPDLEAHMHDFVDKGLEVVRYSPAEERFFGEQGAFAGQDAMIRFGKYVDDYTGWTGNDAVIGNVTQHMAQRGEATGYEFWRLSTGSLPRQPAGPGSEVIGGVGALSYDRMLDYLRRIRAYLYTGTRPASYTLGLMEALLMGVPVVSIGAHAWGDSWGGADLFEGHELAKPGFDNPAQARTFLANLLTDRVMVDEASVAQQAFARETFGMDVIGPQWKAFLG